MLIDFYQLTKRWKHQEPLWRKRNNQKRYTGNREQTRKPQRKSNHKNGVTARTDSERERQANETLRQEQEQARETAEAEDRSPYTVPNGKRRSIPSDTGGKTGGRCPYNAWKQKGGSRKRKATRNRPQGRKTQGSPPAQEEAENARAKRKDCETEKRIVKNQKAPEPVRKY